MDAIRGDQEKEIKVMKKMEEFEYLHELTGQREQLAVAQSETSANLALHRDRADALSGEVAALKAELHGAMLEKRATDEEGSRLRRRTDEAEKRLESALQELHQARIESTESIASKSRLTEVEAQAAVATEKLQLQLAYVQKEADKSQATLSGEVAALTSKVKQVKKLAAKERAAYQEAEGTRVRQIEALKREVSRLRGEREQLKRAPMAALPPGMAPAAGRGGSVRELIAQQVAAESAIVQEAAAMKAAVAGVAKVH